MDETNPSRTSDAASAATRKRRSSILKSQRPPRTPLSELEFHVATPTDTAKSRRVSFSKRTGVAEFVTNEATTTWRYFYEEQNKSLESSGNESGANAPKPTIEHLGKRIFDQQFQEIEAVDFITSLENHSSRNVNNSLNNVNFTQQLAALECTNVDRNLSIRQQNFEMSAFTDHQSKVFGDDFAIPTMGEMSGRIDVNFSAVQSIGTIGEVNDDLDEIQADLQRAKSNVVCPGPFNDRRDLSEYIEVDVNSTNVIMRNDVSDMSITDTIHSPKVQEVSKSNSFIASKKASLNKDYIEDKENIAVYEGCNSPIAERRKTIVYENDTGNVSITQGLPMNIILPVTHKAKEKRKTIVYESDAADISVTQAVPINIMIVNKDSEKRKTIIYENDTGNISVTQAIPSNLILQDNSKTVVSEDVLNHISITTVAKIISGRSSEASNKSVVREELMLDTMVEVNKQLTIVENETDLYNMSITKPIETKHLMGEALQESVIKKQFDMSSVINQGIPRSLSRQSNNVSNNIDYANCSQIKNLTFNDDNKSASFKKSESKESHFKIDMSMDITQEELLAQEVYEQSNKISSNQVSDSNCVKSEIEDNKDWIANKENIAIHKESTPVKDRRKTILYENDTGDISITQVIPINIILPDERATTDKRKTIVFDTAAADVSVTQVIPANIMIGTRDSEKRKTIIYENETCDISVTQAIPSNLILSEISKPMETEYDISDVSFTQAIPVAKILSKNNLEELRKSFTDEHQIIDAVSKEECNAPADVENRTDMINISDTKYLLSEALEKSIANSNLNISTSVKGDTNPSVSKTAPQDMFVYQAALTRSELTNDNTVPLEPQKGDTIDCEVKEKASVSFTKLESKESTLQVNTSMQISQAHLLKQEMYEENKSLSNEQIDSNAELAETRLVPYNNAVVEKSKQAVLDDLLDMSQTSLDASIDNKETDARNASMDSLHTNKDCYDEITQTDRIDNRYNHIGFITQVRSPLYLQCDSHPHLSEESVGVRRVSEKPSTVSVDDKNTYKNIRFEKIRSEDLENEKTMNQARVKERLEMSKTGRSFKDANDTNELLEMLSDLTDKSRVVDDEEKPKEPVRRPSQYAEVNEPRRLSVAPHRQSIVLSREDLLNNISMAQAALQRSIEIDESIADTSVTPTGDTSPPKPARMSNEVVKKLHFEDESMSDTSVKSDVKASPLKKTAFGETAYMKESKGNVIPSYLKGVTEEIKSLMNDLVKPNADAIPFRAREILRAPSTCSTEIQANLIASSQIDIDTDNNSDITSDFCRFSSPSLYTDTKVDCKTLDMDKPAKDLLSGTYYPKRIIPSETDSDRVIIFDHDNPLNNIRLVPPNFGDVHNYNPKSSQTQLDPDSSDNCPSNEQIREIVDTEYNIGNVLVSRSRRQFGYSGKLQDVPYNTHNTSRSTYIDDSVKVYELRDSKANTLITMKGNKELLEASSSLTLVDDAIAINKFEFGSESTSSKHRCESPVKLIFDYDQDLAKIPVNKDFDLISNDDMGEPDNKNKGKKRIYSPAVKDKHICLSSVDASLKQMSKLQKLSDSPKSHPHIVEAVDKLEAEKDEATMDVEESVDSKEVSKKETKSRKDKRHVKKPGTNITVQQLMTEYEMKGDIDQETVNKQMLDAFSRSGSSTAPGTVSMTDGDLKSPEIVSSFTSSKNQSDMRNACSVTASNSVSSARSLRVEFQPEKVSSNNGMKECESSVNVVAKIDMLPFMGSHECEWEASGTDTWSFRLLYARLRLTVRLSHRHDNATRTRVRADTPVLAVTLEIAHADKKNTVAYLCVSFASEAMRYVVGRGCSRAGDVPALLRRCAGVARVAVRWGRAMHEARLHLAYTLRPDASLALKVANIPLRSVWEVTMRLEMGVEDGREVPWPRATRVRVSRVVSDVKVTDEEVGRALSNLPMDWGHVPRAVWKIFKYLKNKTHDDELLGL